MNPLDFDITTSSITCDRCRDSDLSNRKLCSSCRGTGRQTLTEMRKRPFPKAAIKRELKDARYAALFKAGEHEKSDFVCFPDDIKTPPGALEVGGVIYLCQFQFIEDSDSTIEYRQI